MSDSRTIQGRYQLREVLGQGGMGVVYKAFDSLIQREVALKTLHDIRDKAALDLFYKEWGLLAGMVHPNIVEIYDIGEFREDGAVRPFFVMPYLPGVTLDNLIRESSSRLSVERTIDIICQTCRGLQAAHEKGLVHRDVKPSNLLVLDDDAVKIIDFGVAHLVESGATTSAKGTPAYMAPEQVRLERPTPATDIFSLGVVCYEALTKRRPFWGNTESEISTAILQYHPPSISDLNPAVTRVVSRVVHKALAKNPWHRISSAKEFASLLRKALRNEPIEIFSNKRIQPRIDRATRAFATGEFEFAAEVLHELESEGHVDTGMSALKSQIDASLKSKQAEKLVESAHKFLSEQEFSLALRKTLEALKLQPESSSALLLKEEIEKRERQTRIDALLRHGRDSLAHNAFDTARQAAQQILDIRPKEGEAQRLLQQVAEAEAAYLAARRDKAQLYQNASLSWQKGEITAALSKLDRLMELERQSPERDAEDAAAYERFHRQVRSAQNDIELAYAQARKHLEEGRFREASALCEEYLHRHPEHALFRALELDVRDHSAPDLPSEAAEVYERITQELDLDRRVSLLADAQRRYPEESFFHRALQQARSRRDLVGSIVAKARLLEAQKQFGDSIDQWNIVRDIYSDYPGLHLEMERLLKRQEHQALARARARWVERIDREQATASPTRVFETCRRALLEFPGDPELRELMRQSEKALSRTADALELFIEAKQLLDDDRSEEAINAFRRALERDPANSTIGAVLADALFEQARIRMESDWRAAEAFINEGLELYPESPLGRSIQMLAAEKRRQEAVSWCLAKARRLQSEGDGQKALLVVDRVLATYPKEPRLMDLRDSIRRSLPAGVTTPPPYPVPGPAITPAEEKPAGTPGAAPREPAPSGAPTTPAPPASAAVAVTPPGAAAESSIPPPGEQPSAPPAAPTPPPPEPPPPPELPSTPPPADSSPPRETPPEPPSLPTPTPTPPASPPAAPLVSEPVPSTSVTPKPKAAAARRKAPSRPRKRPGVKELIAKWPWLPFALAGAGGLLVVILLVAALRVSAPPEEVPVAAYEITSAIEGIDVSVSSSQNTASCRVPDCRLELPPGEYVLTAELAGYRSLTQRFTVVQTEVAPDPLEISLEPLSTRIAVVTNLPEGRIQVNGEDAGTLDEGAFETILTPGIHSIEISGSGVGASFRVDARTAAQPVMAEAPTVREMQARWVAGFGPAATLFSTEESVPVTLDETPVGDSGPQGLPLSSLSEGLHEVGFGEGRNQSTRSFEVTGSPFLTAFFTVDRNIGTAVVTTGVDGATVVIDDGRYTKQVVRRGRVRVYLRPGEYTARVEHEGHHTTEPQSFRIRKGDETRLEFTLEPLPQMAALRLEGAPPGAEVWLEGTRVGTVSEEGRYVGTVPAGRKRLELRNLPGFYQSNPMRITLEQGGSLLIGSGELPIRAVNGRIVINVQPPSAPNLKLTMSRDGGVATEITAGAHYQRPGNYVVRASALGHQPTEYGASVRAGLTTNFNLILTPHVQERSVTYNLSWLETQDGWSRSGGRLVRRGGDFSLLPIRPSAGTFSFTIARTGEMKWVVDYRDESNYVLCQLDRRAFTRVAVVGGSRTRPVKVAHKLGRQNFYAIRVDIARNSVKHYVASEDGNNWSPLDTIDDPAGDFTSGRFGFYTPGRDEIALTHFEYYKP